MTSLQHHIVGGTAWASCAYLWGGGLGNKIELFEYRSLKSEYLAMLIAMIKAKELNSASGI